MGISGVGIFADDLAADLRGEFRELLGEGYSAAAAVDRLMAEYASSLSNPNEKTVFWFALADCQWKLGRIDERTIQTALRLIENEEDLGRWNTARERAHRERVLEKLRTQLLAPPPNPKHVPRTIKGASPWAVGEVLAFQLASKQWMLIRVIGHHTDKGGRNSVCELLDWTGDKPPPPDQISKLPIKVESAPRSTSQFLFQEPRTKKEQLRVVRTGFICPPAQKLAEYSVFVWPFMDRLFKETFGIS